MKRVTIVVLGAFAAGVAGVACGGVGGDLLFGAGGSSASGGSGSTSNSSSSSGATSSSSGQGGAGSSSSSGSVASSASSSAASSSSSSSAAGSSSSGSTLPVYCDGNACGTGEICCFNPTGPGDKCALRADCAAPFVVVSCSGPAYCPGEFCCAQGMVVDQGTAFQYSGISCQPTCTTGATERRLCDDPPNTDECDGTSVCVQSAELGPPYDVCN